MAEEQLVTQEIKMSVHVVAISGSCAQGYLETIALPPNCKRNGTALLCKKNKTYLITLKLVDETSSGLRFSKQHFFYAQQGFDCPPDGSTGLPDAFSALVRNDDFSLTVEYKSKNDEYSYGLKFDGSAGPCYFDPIIINRF